jgi:hypothetical protein
MARTFWRGLMGLLSAMLLLFAVAQYNDPDPAFWSTIYAIGGIWTGLAAIAPDALRGRLATILLVLSSVITLYGVYEYWPQAVGWWRRETWWHDEEAREGMGLMILAVSVALVSFYRFLQK